MPGYVAEITSIVLLMLSYMIANGTILLFYVSLCLHHRAFYEMVKHSIVKSNQQSDDGVYDNRCGGIFLHDLIQFHMSIKGWVFDPIWSDNWINAVYLLYTDGFWIPHKFTVHLWWFYWFVTPSWWQLRCSIWIWWEFNLAIHSNYAQTVAHLYFSKSTTLTSGWRWP